MVDEGFSPEKQSEGFSQEDFLTGVFCPGSDKMALNATHTNFDIMNQKTLCMHISALKKCVQEITIIP